MISVLSGTDDISSILYRSDGDDICLRYMKERILYHIFTKWKYIMRQGRISYCESNASLKNATFIVGGFYRKGLYTYEGFGVKKTIDNRF